MQDINPINLLANSNGDQTNSRPKSPIRAQSNFPEYFPLPVPLTPAEISFPSENSNNNLAGSQEFLISKEAKFEKSPLIPCWKQDLDVKKKDCSTKEENDMAGALKERKRWFANPKFALTCGMLEITALIYILVSFNVIEGEFFRFGPPIQLFQFTITGNKEFAGILVIFFIHQCMFTWLNEVVSPWILNEIQDPSNRILTFSKPQTIFFINIYYVYFTLNSVMLVNVSLSQLSFLFVMLLADFIATTTLNLYYVWNKRYTPSNDACLEKGLKLDCKVELEIYSN